MLIHTLIFLLASAFIALSQTASIKHNTVRKFFIRLQPELDVIDIDSFVKKDLVLKFQLKCLLNNDTFCDPVGRWLAPRLPFVLLDNKCPKCTPIQHNKIADALTYIRNEKPEIYQALLKRYIEEDEEEMSTPDQLQKDQDDLIALKRNYTETKATTK